MFNSTQTAEQVYGFALASAFVFGRGRYGIGWDGRKSSALLARVATAATMAAGSQALVFGMVPTPVTAFGSRENSCKLSFSVTASHNPREYSGVKVYNPSGMELAREDEEKIERGLLVGAEMESRAYGSDTQEDALARYVEALESRFEPTGRGLKVLVDCANGPGALVTPKVLGRLGHKVIAANAQVSWRFPARLPEPTPQGLTDTAALVRAVAADIGFAHDGDADRLVMIDSSGRVLPDSMLSSMVLKTLGKAPRLVILSENSSSAVEEAATELGARVVRSKVGKTFVELVKSGGDFATEPSKIVDPSWGLWEDGMHAAVRVCDAISRDPSLLEMVRAEPKWHYRQVNLPYSVDVSNIADRAEIEFERFRVSEVRRLDGVKVVFRDESWIMFRASGTEPKTRVYCESTDAIKVDELLDVGKKLVEELAVVVSKVTR